MKTTRIALLEFAACTWAMMALIAPNTPAQPSTNCLLMMNCPSNIVVTSCFNVQEFYTPTASNICCGVNSSVTCSPPSGSIFAVGTTTTVICTANDCLQNTNYCSFTVTVIQGTNCATNYLSVQCPTNIVVASCTNIQEFYAPTVTDNACSNWTVTLSPPSGSFFAPNTTTLVDCFVGDWCGETNDCSFTVTVLPGTNCPTNCITLVCPTNMVLATCSNCAPAFYAATATNTCCFSHVVLQYSLASGTCFPIGTNMVQVTAYDPDCASTPPVSGSFTVTVIPADCSTNQPCCGPGVGPQSIQWLQLPTNTTPLLHDPLGANGAGTWIIANLPGYGNVLITQDTPTNVDAICTNADFGRVHSSGSFDNVQNANGTFRFTQNVPGLYGPYSWGVLPGQLALAYARQYTSNGLAAPLPAYQVHFYFLSGPPSPCSLVFSTIGLAQYTTNTLSQPLTFRTEYDLLYETTNYPLGPSAETELDGVYDTLLEGDVTGTVVSSAYGFTGGDDYNTGWSVFQPTNAVTLATLPSGSGTDIYGNSYPPTTNLYPCLSVAVNQEISDIFSLTVGYLCCTNCPTNCLQVQCPEGKTVPCGAAWTFDAPVAISCCTNPFVTSTGVVTNILVIPTGTVTNGTCPQFITQSWLIEDGCGDTDTCSQIVMVTGCCTNCLSLQCPGNIETSSCTNCALVSYAATATDTCCSNVAITYYLGSVEIGTNYCFPVGQSSVTVQAEDGCSNTASCSFTVSVLPCGQTNCIDLVCPPPLTNTVCGSNCAAINFAASAVDYCCSNAQVSYQLNGAVIGTNYCFPPGQSTVTVQASDSCGNAASGSFTVTVLEVTNAPGFLSAPTNVTICEGTGASGVVIVDNDEWDNSNVGYGYEGDGTVYATNCANYLTANGAHGRNILICSYDFSLNESDLYASLTGAGFSVMRSVPPLPSAAALSSYNAVYVGGDVLSAAEITELQSFICAGGGVYIAAGTGGIGGAAGEAAQWNSLVNGFGLNLASSYNLLTGTLVVPSTMLVTASPVMAGVNQIYNNNGNTVNTLVGYPQAQIVAWYGTLGLIGVSACTSSGTNGCGLMPNLSGQVTVAGGSFTQSIPPGTVICSDTNVTLTVSNACGSTNLIVPVTLVNCSSNCLSLKCPGNIETSSCTNCALVSYAATVTDTCCSNVAITYYLGSVEIGTNYCFPVGQSTVTVQAEDGCSNTASCSFTVSVLPGTGCGGCLSVDCPTNMAVITCSNCTPVHFAATTTDTCCSNVQLSYNLGGVPIATNYCFPLGTNIVQVTATDGCSNIATCSFTVTVRSADCGPIISVGPTNFVLCSGTNGCATMPDEVHASSPILYGLNNTAVGGGLLPSPLPVGSIGDPHWNLVSAPAVPAASPLEFGTNTTLQINSVAQWVSAEVLSDWIAPANDASNDGAEGNYDYQTTFILPQDGSVTITGEAAADDSVVDVQLNGVSTGVSITNGPGVLTPFTLTGQEVAGTNTLDFIVHNNPLIGTNPPADNQDTPTGLQVNFTTITTVTTIPFIIPAAVQATNCDGTPAPGWQSIPPGTRLCNNTNITFTFTNACGQTTSYVATVAVETCCVAPPSGMVLWLTLDESVGDTCLNSAGYNNGLRYEGNTLATHANGPTHNLGQYVYNSLCFDGTDDKVVVPNYAAIDFGTQNFTLDAWVKWGGGTGNQIMLDHRTQVGANYYGYSWYLANGKPAIQLATGPIQNLAAAHSLTSNVWTHLAVTVQRGSATGLKFYVNGGLTDTISLASVTGSLYNTANLWIGASPIANNVPFYGCLDEIELFDRVLPVSQIAGIYDAGKAGKCRPTCSVPAVTTVCPRTTNVVVTVQICNCGSSTMTFNVSFNGLTAAQAGGSPATNGPTVFSGYPSTVTLPPDTCTNFTVDISIPTNLTSAKVVYYQMVIQDGSGQEFSSIGEINDPLTIYSYNCYKVVQQTTNQVWTQTTNLMFVINNPTNAVLNLNAQVSVVDVNLQPETNLVSLNGLLPGTPVTNQVVIPPMGSQSLSVNVNYLDSQPWHPFLLLLSLNLGGNGAFVPVASSTIAQVVPPTVGPPLSTSVTNGQVVVSWDTVNVGWTLLSTPSLGGTNWIPVNLQVLPLSDGSQGVTLPLTNNVQFFQLIGPGTP